MQSGNISANPTVKTGQLLLPYPQFDDIGVAEIDNRDSSYNSLQIKVQKRFSAGAQIIAAYTLSKLIDDTNSEINWLEAASPNWGDRDPYNLRYDRSLDGFDVPNRLVIAGVMDLPFGKGQHFMGSATGITNKIIGGWGVDTIITFQNGFPLPIGGSCVGLLSNSGINEAPCSGPEVLSTPQLTGGSLNDRLAHWFTTSSFGVPPGYTLGDSSRTEGSARADGIKNFDIALFKNTKFGPEDRLALQFRAEFFNTFNRVQFNPPNTGCCGGTFGQVTSQYNLPRVIQFALRMTF
jgi:hypothetical protein